jgi:hypothetical protein
MPEFLSITFVPSAILLQSLGVIRDGSVRTF